MGASVESFAKSEHVPEATYIHISNRNLQALCIRRDMDQYIQPIGMGLVGLLTLCASLLILT